MCFGLKYVAFFQQVLEEAGLKIKLHAYSTNIEGLTTKLTYL